MDVDEVFNSILSAPRLSVHKHEGFNSIYYAFFLTRQLNL